MKNRIINICKALLQAQANSDLRQEQWEYAKLQTLCEKNNIDFNNAITGGMREAKKSIAIQMRGIV